MILRFTSSRGSGIFHGLHRDDEGARPPPAMHSMGHVTVIYGEGAFMFHLVGTGRATSKGLEEQQIPVAFLALTVSIAHCRANHEF